MTATQSAGRSVAIAGFPLSAWAFALRIWAATMVALYAAFWLQLESASSAAVTVGILALQTRGQAYQKALYRILCTIIGVVASFVIAGLFPQTRELFLIGFAGWLGLCVYVGGLLDGNRAYGANRLVRACGRTVVAHIALGDRLPDDGHRTEYRGAHPRAACSNGYE